LVFQSSLIYIHNDVWGGRVVVALRCGSSRLCLLGFKVDATAHIIVVVIFPFALALHGGVAVGTRGCNLALAFVLTFALELLELLGDGVDLGEAWCLADLV
jgi:hypothetical protein